MPHNRKKSIFVFTRLTMWVTAFASHGKTQLEPEFLAI
jgi:hypothetical protein